MASYNDKLDADQQISTEECVSSMIWDSFFENEEQCQELAKEIVLRVLVAFRPDLIEEG
jgi:hypothetical protein